MIKIPVACSPLQQAYEVPKNYLPPRLNKIGKNPHLVSDRETLDSDWRQMNALLKALSVNTDPQSPNANAIEDNLRELVSLSQLFPSEGGTNLLNI